MEALQWHLEQWWVWPGPPFWGVSYDNNILLSSFADHELVYRDPTGGLSILNMADYTTRILMTNSTFVSRP